MTTDDPRLAPFGRFTPERYLTPGYGDHYLFFVGRDDVHKILLRLLTAETMGLKLNMFGYDDDALNSAILTLMKNPNVAVQGTLDKSQAAGVHERKILAADVAADPDFYNSFAVGASATHQISHTKGGVLVAQGLWFEGSTNWSDSGEGTGIQLDPAKLQAAGYKAQNNTLLVSANPVGLTRFSARLDTEHLAALQQAARAAAAGEVTGGRSLATLFPEHGPWRPPGELPGARYQGSRARMRYLITGGAGFIGSALTQRLLDDGHAVTVLDDFSRGNWDRLPDSGDLAVYQGDVRDPHAVTRAMHGCGAVIHAAYVQGTQTFYAEPRQVLDVALRGMLAVLDACAVTGCADLLLLSSSEAYQIAPVVPTPEDVPLTVPDPLNPRYSYGGGKIACELMALAWQRAGVLDRAVIARPHNIYGPDMGREHVIPEFCLRMNQLIAAQPEGIIPFPVQGSGQETRSFCWIGNCTDQLALLLDPATPAGVYHVGAMNEITISQVAHIIAELYGRQIKLEPGMLPKGSPPRRLPDLAKISTLAPLAQTPFSYGLGQTVSWYQAHG